MDTDDGGTGTPLRAPGLAVAMASPPPPPPPLVAVAASVPSAMATPAASLMGMTTASFTPTSSGGICIFSGGTAANSLVDAFQAVATRVSSRTDTSQRQDRSRKTQNARKRPPCSLTYIIPISDNGGSSSELIRFFGGPSVGDIRSRLVRLIPTGDPGEEDEEGSRDGSDGDDANNAHTATGVTTERADNAHTASSVTTERADNAHTATSVTTERAALRALFEHRLCPSDPVQARTEWLDIVEARHLLWTFVPSPSRELIRAVLNTLNLEIVKRARPTSVFNFAGASVGNLFLTGARLFSGSFEAAIYLLSLLCGIPDHVAVLPAINSNFTHHISAGLAAAGGAAGGGADDASHHSMVLTGQVNISHPSAPTSLPDGQPASTPGLMAEGMEAVMAMPASAAAAAPPPSAMTGGGPRTRVKRAATAVDFEDATLPGSLPALRRPQIAFSKEDEEDLPARISRVWYINPYGHEIRPPANAKALAALQSARAIIYSIGSLYTSIIPSLVLRGVGAAIAGGENQRHGNTTGPRRKKVLILNSKLDRETGPRSDPMTAVDFVRAIVGACKQSQSDFGPVADEECRLYITHMLYLERDAAAAAASASTAQGPRVDPAALSALGIQCIAVPRQQRRQGSGRNSSSSSSSSHGHKELDRYDEAALTRALETVIDGSWDRGSDAAGRR